MRRGGRRTRKTNRKRTGTDGRRLHRTTREKVETSPPLPPLPTRDTGETTTASAVNHNCEEGDEAEAGAPRGGR